MYFVDIKLSEKKLVKDLIKHCFNSGCLFENGAEMIGDAGYIGFKEDCIFYTDSFCDNIPDLLLLPSNFYFALSLIDEIIYKKQNYENYLLFIKRCD